MQTKIKGPQKLFKKLWTRFAYFSEEVEAGDVGAVVLAVKEPAHRPPGRLHVPLHLQRVLQTRKKSFGSS